MVLAGSARPAGSKPKRAGISSLAIGIAAIFFLSGCLPARSFSANEPVTGVRHVTVEKGFSSGIRERRFLVIETEKDWEELWRLHRSRTGPGDKIPRVDFGQEMLVGVFAGEKRTGGYSIEIARVEKDPASHQLRVFFRDTSPPPGSVVIQALTQPYHIVKFRKVDFSVEFLPHQGR